MMKRSLSVFVLFAIFTITLPAQVVYVLPRSPGTPANVLDVYLPSPAYPNGGPGIATTTPYVLANTSTMAGGQSGGGFAIDQRENRAFATDGMTIFADAHNPGLYDKSFGFLPLPESSAPAPLLLGGGPITGIAVNSELQVLFMTDGTSLGAFIAHPPYMPLGSPINLSFLTGGPLTGLGFEPSTGTLWGCDSIGSVYNFSTSAVPMGPQPVNTMALPANAGPLGGLCVDTTNAPGTFVGVPFCSQEVAGFHVCVTDGSMILDAMVPGPTVSAIIPVLGASQVGAYGLAFASDAQYLPAHGLMFAGKSPVNPLQDCPIGSGYHPFNGFARPITNSLNGNPNAMGLIDGPPLTNCVFLYDICPLSLVGGIAVGFPKTSLFLNPFSPGLVILGTSTNILGESITPVDFTPVFGVGFTLTGQWAFLDAAAPLGYSFLPALVFTVGDT